MGAFVGEIREWGTLDVVTKYIEGEEGEGHLIIHPPKKVLLA